MGYVERHLLPGERVVYKTRLHWVLFVKPGLVFVGGIALALVLRLVPDPPWVWMIGAAVALIGLGWGLVHYVELMSRVRDPIGFRNHVQQASLGSEERP